MSRVTTWGRLRGEVTPPATDLLERSAEQLLARLPVMLASGARTTALALQPPPDAGRGDTRHDAAP